MAILKRPLKAKRNEPADMVYAYSIVQLHPQDGIKYGHKITYCSDKQLPIGSLLTYNGALFRVQREEFRFKRETA